MAILLILALLGLGATFLLTRVGSRERRLPPGPPTVPVLGNLHIFPTEFAHYKYVISPSTEPEIITAFKGAVCTACQTRTDPDRSHADPRRTPWWRQISKIGPTWADQWLILCQHGQSSNAISLLQAVLTLADGCLWVQSINKGPLQVFRDRLRVIMFT